MKSPHRLDTAGVVLSGICLVHCLALPLVVAALPFVSELARGHLHAQLLAVVVPVSVLAFGVGFRRHRRTAVLAGGGLGLALLVVGGTVAHERYGITADRVLAVAGSLVLAFAHYRNSRLSRHVRHAAS
ncbi:MAG TPA: MerC domain-containing protein [Woeseiaceae bacterium]|nr:MerC domain-containing protein [Woeseiaceae bacterium]